ncbi:MAG: protealysin inhibitor emfourin [Micropruina glycogenica]|uniref:Neutral metalloproteinase n=1 Tax=Micropruina glycogenica TaxID=75385 RepID=A0A2N9JCM7_9ACTN|nr:protealysin inhibitor emfourin [Micropruina glycogenica]SPD85176.1 Thermolysin metallopeptidase, catalytic domain [Micropruina glycogenica]
MTHPRHTIIPPYLLRHLAESADDSVAARAESTLRVDQTFRSDRRAVAAQATFRPTAITVAAAPNREISTAKNARRLPGTVVRREGEAATGDAAADEAYDGFGATWALFHDVYGRNSIDGAGMTLAGTVHYDKGYDNAFWNGERMVFGDGDGEIFGRFTASLEVIGHELTHGVTESTAGLIYQGQPGALNEHVSDVFGVLVKQHSLGQDATTADWLVGADLLLPGVAGVAIRSMISPGTAYDDPRLGKDPQPDHMSDFVTTSDDNGGVHINSGIPNRAFALAARAIGGQAWTAAGQIWFDVLTGADITARTDFATFARLTVAAAAARFGSDSAQHDAVRDGWVTVGVQLDAQVDAAPSEPPAGADAELLLRRTGGLAGLVKERRTTLDELPAKDAKRWSKLLTSDTLQSLSGGNPAVDGFCYRVACEALSVDVTVPEQQLSESQRNLFKRTLHQGDQ